MVDYSTLCAEGILYLREELKRLTVILMCSEPCAWARSGF